MTAYDGKTIAEIIHDYAVVRGDLSEQYARDQLARIIEERIAVARVLAYDKGWAGQHLSVTEPERPGSTRLSAPTSEEQNRINAATVIRRVAMQGKRHPETAAEMLRAADWLRERSDASELPRSTSEADR